MKKTLRLLLSALLLGTISICQAAKLHFDSDGKFKIVQFTDVHLKYGNPASDIAIERINEILDAEKPQLVVFTGDLIYAPPALKGIDEVLAPVSRRGIPFVVTLGNHDHEQGVSNEDIYHRVLATPGCVQPIGDEYALSIYDSGKNKRAATVYCMDSHDYSQIKGVGKYAWFTYEQIGWYRAKAAEIRRECGGDTIPAIAFFHIPLPEYAQASTTDGNPFIGTRREKVACPVINTGLFAAMLEQGDIMATFAGHDHDNDYATLWHGILLAYGRYTGGNTVYNHLPNGARIIELHENSRTFTTWIRQTGNVILDRTEFPASYK